MNRAAAAIAARVKSLLPVRTSEWPALACAFAWFFLLMGSYQILRPIRESLASEQGDSVKQVLFFSTFVAALAGTLAWSWLANRTSRTALVRTVTQVCVAVIAGFGWMLLAAESTQSLWLSRAYFVWVTVFSLFITSTFWSVMADLFSNEQGRRLFGPIASGATLGAIAGSALAGWLAGPLGVAGLVFLSAGLLEGGALSAEILLWTTRGQQSGREKTTLGGSGVFEGMFAILRSPYLAWISVYLALISLCGTTLYMQLTETARSVYADRESRTVFFAGLNLYTQLGSLLAQTLIVGAVIRRCGLGWTLAILPVLYAVVFAVLGCVRSLAILAVTDVVVRTATYGIAVPAREVLFTVVDREAKYKSKNFIDTVVFRGSDSFASGIYVAMKGILGASANLWFFLPLALAWFPVAHLLGRQQQKLAAAREGDSAIQPTT